MIKQFRIQIGFFLEPIYHIISYDTVENDKPVIKTHKLKILNYGKNTSKSIRKSRHSTF